MHAIVERPHGGHIAYELIGRRRLWRPWVVLISGVGHDRSSWEPLLPALRRAARIVLVDNHGVGQSTPLQSQVSVGDLAADIIAVLDHAGLRRAHVVGVSLGGMIAQELAIEHPRRVRRLVLASTTPGWIEGYPFPLGNALVLWRRLLQPGPAGRRTTLRYALSPATRARRPDLVDHLSRDDVIPSADPRSSLLQATAGTRYTNRGRDRTTTAATLVMHGTDDNVVDPRNAEVLARNIPDARLLAVPGAGHLIFWERPELCARALQQFLRWPRLHAAAARIRGWWRRR
ncbi:MAG: alpha/beta hydrolase [Actinobacteria bacterium]|nr:alpha/beta hydrolase [Actinomycetota bacterium]